MCGVSSRVRVYHVIQELINVSINAFLSCRSRTANQLHKIHPKKSGGTQTMKAEGGQPEVHMRAPGGPPRSYAFFSTHLREGEATPQDIC